MKTDIDKTYAKVELHTILDYKNDARFYNALLLSDVKSELITHFLSRLCESRELLPKIKLVRFENDKETESLTITNQDIPIPEHSVEVEAHYSKLDDKNKVQEMISFLNNSSGDKYINHIMFNPLAFLHHILPLRFKFLPESYILKENGRIIINFL